jgi:leucyl aminopeptidase
MSTIPNISFAKFSAPKKGLTILLTGGKGALSGHAAEADPAGTLPRAFEIGGFKGKKFAAIDVIAPEGAPSDRIIAIGTGEPGELTEYDWLKLGGVAISKIGTANFVTVILDLPGRGIGPREVSDFALGMLMRSYSFDKYRSKKPDDEEAARRVARVVVACADPAAAKREFAAAEAVDTGVRLARDLVNEPANILGPVEFAAAAKALTVHGVSVEILTEKEMKKLGMGALLGVAQGSVRPPRMAVMRWNGGRKGADPIAFVGKGVVFDTGGISIKPAAGMEDMKGDMGGAAAVTGLMRALAGRKAKANVVGIIGLVENMPDGNAQRPGDIVTSMSGRTIEVLNTDAEGRLVLCDALHYCRVKCRPKFMINLATLTGAIMVALGHSRAGLFSNNDELANRIHAAGEATDEKVWRMPLGPEYDKLIDSKTADMKNIGGRFAGAVTAAQFLQRFVGDTPWAHLDIAGTAMGSPASEINQSWGSGFGVRLLDRLVRDHYE